MVRRGEDVAAAGTKRIQAFPGFADGFVAGAGEGALHVEATVQDDVTAEFPLQVVGIHPLGLGLERIENIDAHVDEIGNELAHRAAGMHPDLGIGGGFANAGEEAGVRSLEELAVDLRIDQQAVLHAVIARELDPADIGGDRRQCNLMHLDQDIGDLVDQRVGEFRLGIKIDEEILEPAQIRPDVEHQAGDQRRGGDKVFGVFMPVPGLGDDAGHASRIARIRPNVLVDGGQIGGGERDLGDHRFAGQLGEADAPFIELDTLRIHPRGKILGLAKLDVADVGADQVGHPVVDIVAGPAGADKRTEIGPFLVADHVEIERIAEPAGRTPDVDRDPVGLLMVEGGGDALARSHHDR